MLIAQDAVFSDGRRQILSGPATSAVRPPRIHPRTDIDESRCSRRSLAVRNPWSAHPDPALPRGRRPVDHRDRALLDVGHIGSLQACARRAAISCESRLGAEVGSRTAALARESPAIPSAAAAPTTPASATAVVSRRVAAMTCSRAKASGPFQGLGRASRDCSSDSPPRPPTRQGSSTPSGLLADYGPETVRLVWQEQPGRSPS